MKARCALCGRSTAPYVLIGKEAIGPKCAKRAGLTPARAPRGSQLRFVAYKPVRESGGETLDLFTEIVE